MQGPNIDDSEMKGIGKNNFFKGIIPRMVDYLFDYIGNSPEHLEFRIKISIVEIYMEKIRDLLDISKTDLKIREEKSKGIYLDDVTEKYVSEDDEVYGIMKIGNSNRAISATNMNEGSSRSHLVFIMTIAKQNLKDFSTKNGKLFLVDLAGSEKISKTGATGVTLDEGKKINESLLNLGNVINALTDGKSSFIPYRNSKLTRLLQESLGGNAKTTLIIACSPAPYNFDETVSTLRFGTRAKAIQNKAKVNREISVQELQVLLANAERIIEEKDHQIKRLEEALKGDGKEIKDLLKNEVIEEKNEDDDESNFSIETKKIEENYHTLCEELKLRVKELEDELKSERMNVSVQTEKLNNIKNEFSIINAKCSQLENDNKIIHQELAKKDMKIMQYKDELQDKDDEIEAFKDEHKKEIEELMEAKKRLEDDLMEKVKELEQKLIKPEKKNIGTQSSS